MNEQLDPVSIRKALLWASFLAFGSLAVVCLLQTEPAWSILCLLPWLFHRSLLRKGVDLMGTTGKPNFGGRGSLLISFIAATNGLILLVAIEILIGMLLPSYWFEALAPPVFVIDIITVIVLFFYMVHWSMDQLNDLHYYQALRRAMMVISAPPALVLVMLLIQLQIAGPLNPRLSSDFESGFVVAVILGWCLPMLVWSAFPWLYIFMMHKTYKQQIQADLDDGFNPEPIDPGFLGKSGTPEWFVAPENATGSIFLEQDGGHSQ